MWDYHFTHKSNTISSIHIILETEVGSNKIEALRNQAVGRILTNLGDCQVLRKNMVMLFQEKIPTFQWCQNDLHTKCARTSDKSSLSK